MNKNAIDHFETLDTFIEGLKSYLVTELDTEEDKIIIEPVPSGSTSVVTVLWNDDIIYKDSKTDEVVDTIKRIKKVVIEFGHPGWFMTYDDKSYELYKVIRNYIDQYILEQK